MALPKLLGRSWGCCLTPRCVPRTTKSYRNMHKQAPEIFQRSLTSLDLTGLPPITDSGLGETGLEINNPLKRYSLTNLNGNFSGLQLLCYMHVGMALFDPKVDCGSGLQREYEIAKGMTGK